MVAQSMQGEEVEAALGLPVIDSDMDKSELGETAEVAPYASVVTHRQHGESVFSIK